MSNKKNKVIKENKTLENNKFLPNIITTLNEGVNLKSQVKEVNSTEKITKPKIVPKVSNKK